MKKENTIPILEKAISLLTFLGATDNGASQSGIMKQTGISGATCYRMIQTLTRYGWLKRNGDGHYDLSYGLLSAGKKLIKGAECFELMQKHLDSLSERTSLSSKLSVRRGFSEYVTMLRAEPSVPVSVSGKTGAVFPVIEGSVAGALLCNVEKDELVRLIKAAPDDIFEKKEPDLLYGRIAECIKKGYCFSGKVNRRNIEVISMPVFLKGEVFAAISLLGFPGDIEGRRKFMVAELNRTVRECERNLKDENNFKL
ncbi:MAG: helix-turn-helix domain-containing protein [Victivallales bacterium]|jgi:DNA-binding IclR family transcriptional regulator